MNMRNISDYGNHETGSLLFLVVMLPVQKYAAASLKYPAKYLAKYQRVYFRVGYTIERRLFWGVEIPKTVGGM